MINYSLKNKVHNISESKCEQTPNDVQHCVFLLAVSSVETSSIMISSIATRVSLRIIFTRLTMVSAAL